MPDGTESVPPPHRVKLQIGDWTVEPSLYRLTAPAGKVVKLEPKAMAVLLYLANRPGEVVSREALLSGVWRDTVVGDESVTQVILKLRKALGDVREHPAYIHTIPKGGYRLIARVMQSEIVPTGAESAHAGHRRRVLWIAAVCVAVLSSASAAIWWIGRVDVAVPDGVLMASTTAPRETGQAVVSVKPFEALGGDPQALLLAEGITADLATDLSKVSGLSVIGVELVGGRAGGETLTDAAPIRYVVSGSVQRVGERLRLNVHLTDAHTGTQLWSERFDRVLGDFFAIQGELGPKILQVLPAKVTEAELRRVAQRHTRNLEAYEYFQRGQSALRIRQKDENETAREMFRRAIALDATFARAYAGLARTYAADYRQRWVGDTAAALDRAFELALTAHEMNPDVPETDWVLAYVCMQRREHKQALEHLNTAIQRYPSFADGYALIGAVLTHVGRSSDAIAFVRAAMRLNPEGNLLYFLTLGRAYLFLGDLEQARVNLQHALARNPLHVEAHVLMAVLHVLSGDKGAGAWEAEEIRTLQSDFAIQSWLQTYPMTDAAQKTKLVQALRQIGF